MVPPLSSESKQSRRADSKMAQWADKNNEKKKLLA
jgi:hypothetical protein